jgi:hypothetical protein
MAKKKYMDVAVMSSYTPPSMPDNNPDGPSNLPDYDLNGCRYPKDKMSFPDMLAQGECKNAPDVIVQNANGVSSSQGQNKGAQNNWSPDAGIWNKTDPFDGGNLTGM